MDIKSQKSFFERLAKGIAAQFGSNCEVAIHDLTKDYESTIVAIENGHITNRRIGDPASEIVLEALNDGCCLKQDHLSYLTRTKEGRILKSTSIFIHDDNPEKVTGLIGINYDISDLIMANKAIDTVITVESETKDTEMKTITANVTELLDILIDESNKFIGKPVAMMTKEEKIKAIQYLDEKGAFLIKKSGDKVSKYYDISKYTLYNYLDATPEP